MTSKDILHEYRLALRESNELTKFIHDLEYRLTKSRKERETNESKISYLNGLHKAMFGTPAAEAIKPVSKGDKEEVK